MGGEVGTSVRLLASYSSSFSTRCSSQAFCIPTKQNDVSMNVAYDTKSASCSERGSVQSNIEPHKHTHTHLHTHNARAHTRPRAR